MIDSLASLGAPGDVSEGHLFPAPKRLEGARRLDSRLTIVGVYRHDRGDEGFRKVIRHRPHTRLPDSPARPGDGLIGRIRRGIIRNHLWRMPVLSYVDDPAVDAKSTASWAAEASGTVGSR